jgi:hypothetical protein
MVVRSATGILRFVMTMNSSNYKFNDIEEVASFVAAFERGDWPRADWTHHTHLTMATWYLFTVPPSKLLATLEKRIRSYNESVGIVNDQSSGYHETLTRFWITVIRDYFESNKFYFSIEVFRKMARLLGHSELPLEYYSRDLLFSARARSEWVDPDLKGIENPF